MRQKKTSLLLAVTASLALSLTGCSGKSDNVSNNVTNYYTITMDGDLVYYDENSENVVAASTVASEFMTACIDKSYLNVEFKEYDYYRASTAEDLISAKRQDLTRDQLIQYQLIINALGQEVTNIEFYYLNGLESCMVTIDSFSEFENATSEYEAAAGISVGKKYKRATKVLLVKEDGWKVDSYTQTAREEA